MKLSFVIPAYNEESYIGKCLESVVSEQKNADCEVEIIVVNNASTDSTGEIAKSFPGVIVVDEPRKGLTFARQAGFKAATGELIANIDSDSVLTPGWIETVLEEFSKNKKLVALSGPFIYYDLPLAMNLGIRSYYYFGFGGYLVNRFILKAGSLLQGGNFVVTKSALEKIGGYDLSITFYGEDTDMARRMSEVGDTKFTFKLPMYSSGRRLKYEGVFTMLWKYPINYFWVLIFKKPFTNSYIDIRQGSIVEQPKTTLKKMNFTMAVIRTLLALFLLGGLAEAVVNEIRPDQTLASTIYERFQQIRSNIDEQ